MLIRIENSEEIRKYTNDLEFFVRTINESEIYDDNPAMNYFENISCLLSKKIDNKLISVLGIDSNTGYLSLKPVAELLSDYECLELKKQSSIDYQGIIKRVI